MKDYDIEDLIDFAQKDIHRLGEKALSYYGGGKSNMKFDESLVTEAELSLSESFQDQLHDRFPDHQVFGNSSNSRDYTHSGHRYLWVHDPLDGVANFQAGIPIWGMSIALLENFWPIFGMFFMPSTGDLFYARPGGKAHLGEKNIRVSSLEDINDESLLLTFSRFHNHYKTTFPGKIRDFGCTSAHLCYVAMGRADAAVIGNESYQDLAAARVILEVSGGGFYGMDGRAIHLNEYIDAGKIEEHLIAGSPGSLNLVRESLQPI